MRVEGHERPSAIDVQVDSLDQVATVDAWLRSSLRSGQTSDSFACPSPWLDTVSGAVYRYGVISVDLLRQYRSEGFLQGERLAVALEELGYIEDESSRSQRRSLLVDALSELDPHIRQAAAQGLTYLADAAGTRGTRDGCAVGRELDG